MRETGIVREVSGDFCKVGVKRSSACGDNCATCSAACKQKEAICTAKNTVGAKVGQRVIIEINTEKVLKSAFLVYILPIFVLIGVYLAADSFKIPYPAIFAFASMIGVFAVLFLRDRRMKEEFISEVLEILEK